MLFIVYVVNINVVSWFIVLDGQGLWLENVLALVLRVFFHNPSSEG